LAVPARSGCTGLSGGAPDSVWCARLNSGEQAALGKVWRRTTIIHRTIRWCTGRLLGLGAPDSVRCQAELGEQAALGKVWRRTAIIHRTVRWCTGLSGEPTAASATVGRAIRGRRVAHANGRQGAPDCPVCQLPQICNGRLRQNRKEICTGHATVVVRWCTGLSGAPPDRKQS
jgi:hypothetical protein